MTPSGDSLHEAHEWRAPIDGEPREESAVCRKCGAFANSEEDEPCPIDLDAVNTRREDESLHEARVEAIDLKEVEARAKASFEAAGANFKFGIPPASQLPWEKWDCPMGKLHHYVQAVLSLTHGTAALAERDRKIAELTAEDERLRTRNQELEDILIGAEHYGTEALMSRNTIGNLRALLSTAEAALRNVKHEISEDEMCDWGVVSFVVKQALSSIEQARK